MHLNTTLTRRLGEYTPSAEVWLCMNVNALNLFRFVADGRIDIADFGPFSVRYFTTLT